MIPPSLLNASFLFTLVPIWEQEPAPAPPCPPPGADAPDAPATEAAPASNASVGADADGVNDQVALRMVFKGYRLAVMTDWAAEANPGYERWVENRGDDEAERQRQDQRARSAVRPSSPHAPSGAAAAAPTPSPSNDSE